MRFLGNYEVIITELPDELQFVISTHDGWFGLLLIPVLCATFLIWVWHTRSYVLVALVIIGLLMSVANSNGGPVTRLNVSAEGIIATGTTTRIFSKRITPREVRFRAYEIKTIGYYLGDEGEQSGLYVNRNILLVDLDEKHADVISDAIRRKFPLLENPDHTPTSLLHGDDSGITTLGLSNIQPHSGSSSDS